MPVEVQNQIRMLGQPIAAEVARRRASHRRWLKLAPLKGDIQLLEVEAPIDVDPIEWPKSDDDCVIASVETFPSLPEAISALTERGVDTDAFDAVWKGDNPF